MSDQAPVTATERLLEALDVAFDQARQGRRPTRDELEACVRALLDAVAAAAPAPTARRPARAGRPVAIGSDGGEAPRER